ncbi:uncharacterized protein [Amphiura filiformis]|uniref:uncharacterized protein n=1 Tax=Amphiura filiformis TaxID=82378 RepID=UPI003B21D829
MGQGKSNGDNGGSVFVLLCILVLIVGIVAAAGMVMAVLNYNRGGDAPINISVDGTGGGPADSPKDYNGGSCTSDCGGRGSSVHDVHYDTRIWSIQASGDGYRRVSYIDRKNRVLKGYLTDVVNAVCQIAGKNCELVNAEWPTCWNNGFPQQGLLGRWFDACSLWGTSLDRLRSYDFSAPFTPTAAPVLLTLPGNPTNFDPNNLSGARIGFLGGWWSDRFCLLYSSDFDIADDRIFEYYSADELLEALSDRDVDAIFVSNELPFAQDGSLYVAEALPPCLQGGDAMMTRKDSLFNDWWDPAFDKLVNSRTYREICNDIDDPAVHGNVPGRSASDICVNL